MKKAWTLKYEVLNVEKWAFIDIASISLLEMTKNFI